VATFLGIEIGGTKLQLGVGRGNGELQALERTDVDPSQRATGILDSIERIGSSLIQRHDISHIGIGFGGPIDRSTGRVTTSHQIQGWDDFPLAEWCQTQLGLPAVLGNDCDSAALAEASFGAGKGKRRVFYVTVGTGIGGGFVVDKEIVGTDRPAVSEIGHLRPGPSHRGPEETVESIASGWGIAALAQQRLEGFIAQSIATARNQVSDGDRSQWKQHLSSLMQIGREY